MPDTRVQLQAQVERLKVLLNRRNTPRPALVSTPYDRTTWPVLRLPRKTNFLRLGSSRPRHIYDKYSEVRERQGGYSRDRGRKVHDVKEVPCLGPAILHASLKSKSKPLSIMDWQCGNKKSMSYASLTSYVVV